jgi:hypothetical protein
MTRRFGTLCAGLVLVALAVSACGSDGDGNGTADAPDRVQGVILHIEAERLDRIESFTLKSGDDTYRILIDADRDYEFNLGHLHEHLASSEPVVVDLEARGDELYAVTIEDA